MVARSFELPDLGEGIVEGELVSWLVDDGDTVEEDQVIAEVETDKALVEIPSRYDGVVKERHYEEGETVPVDATFVTFEVDDAGDAAAVAEVGAGDANEAGASTGKPASGAETEGTGASGTEGTARSNGTEPTAGETPVPDERVFASPSKRTMARKLGIDIGRIDGSGPGGRVTTADVQAHAQSAGESTTARASDGVREAPAGRENGSVAVVEEPASRERTLAMPATRKLADELGVDLDIVPASEEREGEPFVTPEDVRGFAERGREVETAGRATPAPQTTADAERTASTAGAVRGTSEAAEADNATETDLSDRPGDRVPYRGVRRTIGEQMAESKFTAPHVSHHDEFDATDLVELRDELDAAAGEDVKLTYLPFVVKAITSALKEHPYLNASLDEEAGEIVLYDEYNIGIAVATDAGLMVPVVADADTKGLKQLATEIEDLATRARNRTIAPEEMQGGTFTITNVGVIGGEFSSPIINHPEAAIFAMGPIQKRPWVVDDEVVARTTMRFSMSIDHRLVDGADAAQFSNRVKELLVDPLPLLLE
ncbi:MAG: 2-oxo acid dehydrogenase subunit E2 [Halobellus sp.]|uniref:2-oxo acid dehydrogenase subunit E2 n=1 Tax=Halobellus sp. TaxID=1979212 RepID=UPI0035D46341